jgi:hypothetical protein
MSCSACCRKLSLTCALLAMVALAISASAQTCLQNEYNLVNKQKLNCTANDVRIAQVTNIRDLNGAPLTSCIGGSTFSFIADFEIVTTSAQARENIGLYIATDSQTQALTGTCDDNIISPLHQCPGAAAGVLCGSDNYHETDAPPDNCGDTSSSDNSGTFGSGAQKVTLEIDNFLCQAAPGTNQLVLPNCTSWQVPGSTIQCVSPSPQFPYPFDANNKPEAIPGSPSKCNCGTVPLAIIVQTPSAAVTKACTTADSPGSNTSCSITPEGGSVTYTVTVDNQSNFGDIVIDEICDDQYGSIFTASGYTPACPAGTIGTKGTLGTTTCTGATVTKGTPYSCTFNATQAEDVTVTDKVTVRGHGAQNGTFGPTDSNTVTVVSNEAPTTASVTKSLVSTTAACATVRYGVDVQDTSAAGTDETVALSALNDNGFGSITSVHNSVLGTTCGVASGSAGLGTLSGSTGGGSLPATIAVGGHYTCQFDAQFCGTLTTINPASGACNGIQHSNQVTGTETGDEGETVTESANTLTVYECVSSSSSSSP